VNYMNFAYPPKALEHDEMKVSIIICAHRSERCEDLVEALQQAGKFCRDG
jgi:Tfp pilus assembly PilM family ATPase